MEKSRHLDGILKRVVYRNPENAWSVVRLEVAGNPEPVTVVGSLPGIQPGDRLRLQGEWRRNPKYGEQFQARTFESVPPDTLAGIRRYLGSGRFPGIGKVIAARILKKFGASSLEILENQPERIREVEGIGEMRAEKLREMLSDRQAMHAAMIFLQGHDISAGLAERIYRRFGVRTVSVVREDPYRLSVEITGVGFRTADRIATGIGFAPEDPRRVEAGLLHILSEASEEGHVFTPQDRLARRTSVALGIGYELVEEGIDRLVGRHRLIRETHGELEALYLPELHGAETSVAENFLKLLASANTPPGEDWDRAVNEFQDQKGVSLAGEQKEAIRKSLHHKVLIITGGPGTGKTTLIQGILWFLERQGRRIQLCAPTGRAARRMRDATGHQARTLHRLLEFQPRTGDFLRDRTNPLDADAVIVDEASMIDIRLAHHLLEALPADCRLILVGDIDQLPPVGPGNLLRDLIQSGIVETVRLSVVHRQGAASLIVSNAHRVRRGEPLEAPADGSLEDFYFIEREGPEPLLETVKQLISERIPQRFGLHPIDDVQVLSPMHRGLLGVTNLNEQLQELLNPGRTALVRGNHRLKVGDKVMQIRNNYEREVFNGDLGRVTAIDQQDTGITVRFEDRVTHYQANQLDELTLAYACSVHKSQGSEYPGVIVILHTQHSIMLQRNLLYTAMTRGRRLVILVGSRRAVNMAIRNHRIQKRYTRLAEKLRRSP